MVDSSLNVQMRDIVRNRVRNVKGRLSLHVECRGESARLSRNFDIGLMSSVGSMLNMRISSCSVVEKSERNFVQRVKEAA